MQIRFNRAIKEKLATLLAFSMLITAAMPGTVVASAVPESNPAASSVTEAVYNADGILKDLLPSVAAGTPASWNLLSRLNRGFKSFMYPTFDMPLTELSSDERYMSFMTYDLEDEKGTGRKVVYIQDRSTAEFQRVRTPDTTGTVVYFDMTPDARYVVYTYAEEILSGITKVYLYDRTTDELETVSGTSGTNELRYDDGEYVSISADGRYVAFDSDAKLVPQDMNEERDVYLYDREANGEKLKRISVPLEEGLNTDSWAPSLSGDGSTIAFVSKAKLTSGEEYTGTEIVYIYHLADGTVKQITHGRSPSVSGDGRVVAFTTYRQDLVPGDSNGKDDIYVYDTGEDSFRRVSLQEDGSEHTRDSRYPSISQDGAYVAYEVRRDSASDPAESYVAGIQDLSSAKIAVPESDVKLGTTSMRPTVGNGGTTITFFSSYMEPLGDTEFESFDYFVATSGTEPIWPEGSSIEASNIGKDSITVSWPEATDAEGVTGYALYLNGARIAYIPAGEEMTYTLTDVPQGTDDEDLIQVEAINNRYHMSMGGPSYTWIREGGEIPPDESLYFDWVGERSSEWGPLKQESTIELYGQGPAGREASVEWTYMKWEGDVQVQESDSLPLEELAEAPGLYRGSFKLPPDATELSEMKLVLTGEGKVEEIEADDLPLAVGGNLDIEFTGVPPEELQGAVFTLFQADVAERSVTLTGNKLELIEGLEPDEETRIVLYTPDYQYEMARLEGVMIEPGRTTSIQVPVTLPAQMRVKVLDTYGKPVPDIRVDLWDSEHQLVDTVTTGIDGATGWRKGLLQNQTLTAELDLDDVEYELAPGTSLSITLDKGDNELLVNLISPNRGKLEVTVRDPENKLVYDSIVTATQNYKGKPVVTRGRTSFDGKVRLDLYAGEATLEAIQPNYQLSSGLLKATVKAETTTTMEIPMNQPDNYVVNLNVYKKALDTDWLGPLNMNDEFLWTTVALKPDGAWVKGYFSNSYTLAGRPGSEVEACVEGNIYGFARGCGTAVMDENSNANVEVRLEEKGARIQGEVETGRNIMYSGSIYEITPNGGKRWVTEARDDQLQSHPFNVNIPTGGTFRMEILKIIRDTGHQNQYEYATVEFTVEENQIKDLGKITFSPSSYFMNQSGNYLTAQPARAIPGSTIVMKAAYRNNTNLTAEDAHLLLEIPEDMTVVTDSLGNMAVTGGAGEAVLDEGILRVPLGDLAKGNSGTVSYKLQVSPSFNKASVSTAARIQASLNTESVEETIGTVHLDTPRVTLDAPDKISSPDMQTVLSGYAPAGRTVHIYDTDVRIGGAVANASGIWKVNVTLVDMGNQSMHALRAETEMNGVKLQSDKSYAEYDVNFPKLVRMAYSQAPNGRWISLEVGKNVPDLPYTVVPGHPFLFDLEFTQPDQVEHVRVYMDGQDGESIPAVREGDLFRATVPTTQNALGAIYVDYDVKERPVVIDDTIEDIDQIRASMPPLMRDFEVVSREPYVLKDGIYSGSAILNFPQLDDTKMDIKVTYNPDSGYIPTTEEVELANRSGLPVILEHYEASETDTTMSMKMSGYLPSNLLVQEEGSLKSIEAFAEPPKEPEWKKAAQFTMEMGISAAPVGGTIMKVKGQYKTYSKYEGKISKILHNVEVSGMDCVDEMPTTVKEAGKALAAVILGEVGKTALKAWVGAMALTGPAGYAAGGMAKYASIRIDRYVDQQINKVGSGYNECKDDEDGKNKKRGIKVASPKWIYDPSGFVYEAVESNPLEGVTATVLYQDTNSGAWKVWDAAEYEQVNPQLTDGAGKYGWDVPPGKWKVVWSKAGYESLSSTELDVPPPHTEVNAGLISRAAPQISSVQGVTYEGGSYVDITFSKYLKVTELPKGAVILTGEDQNQLEGTIKFIQLEKSAADPGISLSRTVRFIPKTDLSVEGKYSVKLGKSSFSSYANVMMLDKDTGPHPVTMRELDVEGPTAVKASMESGGRMIRISFNEPIQTLADAAKFTLKGTAGIITSAVAATKQGSSESFELLLTLSDSVMEASELALLAGAVKDKEGNLSGEGILALTPDVNPNLSGLTVGSGTLTPVFNPAQTEYTLELLAGTKELEITAVTADTAAKLTIGSEPAVSGMAKKLTLPEDGIIEVTADLGSGTTAKTYRIHVSVAGGGEPTPTPTPSATATPTPTPSATATPTPSATATPTPSATATPTPTASATAIPTPTASATTTPTPTVSATATPTPTATASATPTATASPTPTASVSPTASANPTESPTPTIRPTSTPGGEPKNPLDVSEGAKISSKTTPDGKTTVYVDLSAESILAALKDGLKGKTLYFELKDRADGVILQIPAQGMQQMKNAEATLQVKTVLINVKINAAVALKGTSLADGGKYRLVVVKTGEMNPATAAENAGKPGKGMKLLSPPVLVHAETISNDLAAPVPVAAVKRALQGEFVSLSEKKELVDVYRYDTAASRWVYVKSTPNANGTGLVFDINTMGPYAALTIMHRHFDDTAGHWAEQDIDWMVRHLLVNGTSESAFKPNDSITRAEFTAMLVRALNLSDGGKETSAGFTDVDPSAWYSEAVQSAVSKGLVKGWDNDHFGPNKTITREEMAVMIGRAYPLLGAGDPSAADLGLLGQYSDSSNISSWAKKDVAMVLNDEIMKGITDSGFEPAGITTRAQAAVVLKRLLSKFEE
ncbi:S-layer homology domain-containing protein [Paenibacillus pedocola]|uniref:S-layer homology domain-containing protein n=1 Tax=Paenibacillus pedocola TaxID=3242193 RepID=UPI0028776E1D|nr:S-layer homology domain-containing protein [Paenibacillus typhae]